jgi:hypothetical protein
MDIVTKAEVEQYLSKQLGNQLPQGGVPSDLISDVSYRLARLCGRDDWGGQSERTEYHDGGSLFLFARIWPVISVASIYDDTDHVWASDTLIDASDYWFESSETAIANRGIIRFEYAATVAGEKNLKFTYTGGYLKPENIPNPIRRAAMIQIATEVQRMSVGHSKTLPGPRITTPKPENIGLTDDVMQMMQPFIRSTLIA